MSHSKIDHLGNEAHEEAADSSAPFWRRWSTRKANAAAVQEDKPTATVPATEDLSLGKETLTDADMPVLASLDEHSDYSVFFSPKVSEELRRLALRKLFHSPKFNVTDGLDDYNENYTHFAGLGNRVTQDMRHRIQVAAERLAKPAATNETQPEIGQEQDTVALHASLSPSDPAAPETPSAAPQERQPT